MTNQIKNHSQQERNSHKLKSADNIKNRIDEREVTIIFNGKKRKVKAKFIKELTEYEKGFKEGVALTLKDEIEFLENLNKMIDEEIRVAITKYGQKGKPTITILECLWKVTNLVRIKELKQRLKEIEK